jgi:alkylation response protein AidB-like acyl-CoA dehydrogenase
MRAEPTTSSAHLTSWSRRWQRQLFDAGLLVPGWPPELGGRHLPPVQQLVYHEEMAKIPVMRTNNPQGLGIIAPSIHDYGSEFLKQRYLVPTLRAEIAWCLGMSEPGAGSDLAALSTRGEVYDDHFVVSGQKIWTSGAHHADRCFCFVRTDPAAPKHRGISVLIIDMKAKGVTTRPCPTHGPRARRLQRGLLRRRGGAARPPGRPLHQGWSISTGSLAHERGMMWLSSAARLDGMLERIFRMARSPGPDGRRIGESATFRDELASLYVDAQAIWFMGYQGFAKFAKGKASPEHSVLKLFGRIAARRASRHRGPGRRRARRRFPPGHTLRRQLPRSLDEAVPDHLRSHDLGGRLRDPAQHHRAARPGLAQALRGPGMKMDDMILVSVDDHVCEPPDMWRPTLPAKWKDRAPRLVHKPDGSDVWVFEGQQIPNVGLNAVAGRRPEEYGMEPTALSQLRPGCYDIDARIGDMNANGVLGSLCFPTVPGFVGELFGRKAKAGEPELAITMLRAYNDWHIDDWCGKHPGRFIPLAIPPIWDTAEMAREVRRVAAKGCHAITFADNPKALGYPSLHDAHWDPFWKACSDEGMVVCIHIGSGTRPNMQDVNAPVEVMIAGTPISLFNCASVPRLFQVSGAQDRALRGRDRLDPVLPRAHGLRAPTPPSLDLARLPERQEAERRVPRARDLLLHRRRGRRAQPRPDRDRQHHLGVRSTRTPTRPG